MSPVIHLSFKLEFCGDPVSKLEFCEYCINGKGHRLSFKLSTQRAKEVFEYIHSDLWGPSKVQVTSFSFL